MRLALPRPLSAEPSEPRTPSAPARRPAVARATTELRPRLCRRLIGKMTADGSEVPGREGQAIEAGTILYKVLWDGFPPEIAT